MSGWYPVMCVTCPQAMHYTYIMACIRKHQQNVRKGYLLIQFFIQYIYITTSFRDMVEEREELLKHVFPQLRKFCSDRGVFLTQVDLRWGITTEQSKSGNTINICLSEGKEDPHVI